MWSWMTCRGFSFMGGVSFLLLAGGRSGRRSPAAAPAGRRGWFSCRGLAGNVGPVRGGRRGGLQGGRLGFGEQCAEDLPAVLAEGDGPVEVRRACAAARRGRSGSGPGRRPARSRP